MYQVVFLSILRVIEYLVEYSATKRKSVNKHKMWFGMVADAFRVDFIVVRREEYLRDELSWLGHNRNVSKESVQEFAASVRVLLSDALEIERILCVAT